MNRDAAIALMLRLEGGEANLKGDPGGHTKYGITQATLNGLSADWANPLPANVGDLTLDQAAFIYRQVQWSAIVGDSLPAALACLMLNAAVNMGTGTAIRILQECLNLKPDGILGPFTLRCIGSWRPRYQSDQTLAQEFAACCAVRYASLEGKEPQFMLGWFRRLFLVYTLAVQS